ncbi:MAG TPA: helix-turn-helix domain-containing protein [Hyphomicrobiales bacterium]|nr:helix-turn-helix domain-containing protein [Hyphomicrobiales bacterium]
MKSYGQFCPVAKASEVFCARWTSLILRDLAGGATRFSQLKRGIPFASPTLLSRRLKELEAEGIIERRKSPSGRSWTYHLTQAGREFIPVIEALGVWGQRWSRRELAEHEINLDLLLWAMENSVKPDAFGAARTLVEMQFTDQPKHKQRWWFLNENGTCELCIREPGLDVDLYIVTNLPDMIYIWRGDLSLHAAMESNRLEAHGDTTIRRAMLDWLGVSTLAHISSQRADLMT